MNGSGALLRSKPDWIVVLRTTWRNREESTDKFLAAGWCEQQAENSAMCEAWERAQDSGAISKVTVIGKPERVQDKGGIQ